MARAIWKGAISFGLVHIPVSLVSATTASGIDFDWLDERSMDPVGYKRINKTTGKEVASEHIVKGIAYEKGRYVIISDDEIKAALPRATQTIDIFAFLDSAEIPLLNIYKPYFLSPNRRGEKVYALLRETLIMLRWPAEVRGIDYLDLKDEVRKPELSNKELDMAKRLVKDMTASWEPDEYRNTFEEQIMALVDQKVDAGEIQAVETEESDEERQSADVVDLTELLKRSLGGKAAKSSKGSKSASTKSPSQNGGASKKKSG